MTDPIAIESPQANINRVRFAGRDFFTFVDDIVSRIQLLFVTEFDDFVATGTGQMLIDIVAWAGETLSFYIDRNATESYLATARVRKSINRLARQNGYKPFGAVAAAVDLEVTLSAVQTFDVPVPEGFQFRGPNDLIFESVEDVTFPAGEGPTSVPRSIGVREGVTREEVFTADGTKNLTFRLSPGEGKFVGEGTVTVTVAGATWTESKVITFDKTDQYELDLTGSPPLIRFGDGQAGNVPANGDEIRVVYVAVSGRSGQVTAGTITDVVSPLVVAATIIELNITNPLASTAGDNEEGIDSVRANAAGWFSAREVAVTAPDYRNLSQAFSDAIAGTVAVAQAFVATSADDDFALQLILDNIRDITGDLKSDVQAATAQITSDSASLEVSRAAAASAVTDMDPSAVLASSTAARNAATSAQDRLVQIGVDGVDIQDEVVTGKANLAAIPSGGSDALTTATRALLDGSFDLINAEAVAIVADGSSAEANLSTILSQLNSIDSDGSDISADRTAALAELNTTMPPLIASIDAQVVVIDARVSTGFETSIETELDAVFDHVDSFLAEDCQANLVQVPILTRDVDGFLQAPPIALTQGLQTYLDERNDVTHVVNVVSGASRLVLADIVGTIGITEGFVQATVLANVNKAIEDLLRVREFGADLRLSDIYSSVVPDKTSGQGGIDGVSYANFQITGDPVYLDANGDLIVGKTLVITKGSITLTGVTAP